MVTRFEAKHKDREDEIIQDMLDIYKQAENVILGTRPLTKLTYKAYEYTLNRLEDQPS